MAARRKLASARSDERSTSSAQSSTARSGRQVLPPTRLDPSYHLQPPSTQALNAAARQLERDTYTYEVDHICEERQRPSRAGIAPISEFRIRWKGYGPGSDTWEPMKHIHNGPKLVEKFRQEKRAVEEAVAASDAAFAAQMVRVKPPVLALVRILPMPEAAMSCGHASTGICHRLSELYWWL